MAMAMAMAMKKEKENKQKRRWGQQNSGFVKDKQYRKVSNAVDRRRQIGRWFESN